MRRLVLCIATLTCCLPEYTLVDSTSDAATDSAPLQQFPDIFAKKLVLWLDADEASTITFGDAGTNVTQWRDRSSWHNDATAVISNDTSASPTSSITHKSKIAHGHDAMSFTGIWNATGIFSIPDTLPLEFGTNDFAVTMVVAYANLPGPDEYSNRAQLWSKTQNASPYWGSVMLGNAYSAPLPDGGLGPADSIIFAGIENFIQGPSAGVWSSTDKWNNAQFHVFTMRKDTTNALMYVRTDGIETTSVAPISTAIDLSAFGQPVEIGGHTIFGLCCWSVLQGDIAEVIVVNGSSLTPDEMSALGLYIKTKYALTL
jgi:hypothetical protein